MTQPIIQLAIQVPSGPGPQRVPGWYFNPTDLNSGVGGAYIYAGWKRGTSNGITHIRFATFNEAHGTNPYGPDGWQWSPIDLNQGAGGQWIYMFWKRVNGYRSVYNMTFLVTDHSSPPSIPGYQAINIDLNRGSGGPYIWPYVTYDPNNGSDLALKMTNVRGATDMAFNVTEEEGISHEISQKEK